jgi:hypothetical protein
MNFLIGFCVGVFLFLAITDLFSMKDKAINEIYIDFAKLAIIAVFLVFALFLLNSIFGKY